MVFSEHPDNTEVAVIKDFERKLNKRFLRNKGDVWYAEFLPNPFPDEIPSSESFVEGAKTQVTVNHYERDPKARHACIQYHGTTCKCCGFDFEKVYGEHRRGFIHVHPYYWRKLRGRSSNRHDSLMAELSRDGSPWKWSTSGWKIEKKWDSGVSNLFYIAVVSIVKPKFIWLG